MEDTNHKLTIHDISIAQVWYNFGVENDFKEPKFVFQFMARWVAFNFLYYKHKDWPNEKVSECVLVERIIERNYDHLVDIEYDKVPNIKILTDAPVYSGFDIPRSTDYDEWKAEKEYFKLTRSHTEIYYKKKWKAHQKELEIFDTFKTPVDTFKTPENRMEKLVALFKTIYQIRCNLFHGSKVPTGKYERDKQLIEVANKVLELYLPKLIELEKNQ